MRKLLAVVVALAVVGLATPAFAFCHGCGRGVTTYYAPATTAYYAPAAVPTTTYYAPAVTPVTTYYAPRRPPRITLRQ